MQVEWLILADAAQVVGGKLYLIGGGWDVLTVNSGFPVVQHCAIAAAFRVGWNETNQPYAIEIEVADEDLNALLNVGARLEVGRPPGIPSGQDQRAQLALDLAITFERPGTYVAIARVEGEEQCRVPFRVIAGPLLAQPRSREEQGS
ncbi:MAG: hypothetical protein HYU88_13530 [Chloroflexi bacterium]|nr:hypothetical protein [Chloroflexota bacterium]MBI4507277.1 hypothetical protein [Chloroflexota bacterium]